MRGKERKDEKAGRLLDAVLTAEVAESTVMARASRTLGCQPTRRGDWGGGEGRGPPEHGKVSAENFCGHRCT